MHAHTITLLKMETGKKNQSIFKSQHKSPVISWNSSKNVKKFDHNYHHFALSNPQMILETKEESCPKNKSWEKELYNAEGIWGIAGGLRLSPKRYFKVFQKFYLTLFVNLLLPSPPIPYCAFTCGSLYLSCFAELRQGPCLQSSACMAPQRMNHLQ